MISILDEKCDEKYMNRKKNFIAFFTFVFFMNQNIFCIFGTLKNAAFVIGLLGGAVVVKQGVTIGSQMAYVAYQDRARRVANADGYEIYLDEYEQRLLGRYFWYKWFETHYSVHLPGDKRVTILQQLSDELLEDKLAQPPLSNPGFLLVAIASSEDGSRSGRKLLGVAGLQELEQRMDAELRDLMGYRQEHIVDITRRRVPTLDAYWNALAQDISIEDFLWTICSQQFPRKFARQEQFVADLLQCNGTEISIISKRLLKERYHPSTIALLKSLSSQKYKINYNRAIDLYWQSIIAQGYITQLKEIVTVGKNWLIAMMSMSQQVERPLAVTAPSPQATPALTFGPYAGGGAAAAGTFGSPYYAQAPVSGLYGSPQRYDGGGARIELLASSSPGHFVQQTGGYALPQQFGQPVPPAQIEYQPAAPVAQGGMRWVLVPTSPAPGVAGPAGAPVNRQVMMLGSPSQSLRRESGRDDGIDEDTGAGAGQGRRY